MSTTWKALIALALVVPLAAYVVGSLVPSSADDGDRNRPVIIGDRNDDPAPPSPSDTRTPDEEPTTKPGRADDDADGGDDGGDDDGADDDSGENGAGQGGSGQRGDQTDDGRRPAGGGRDDRDADDRDDRDDDGDDGDDDGDDD